MSLKELEEEIIEIEKIKGRFKSGSIQWNNIETIITDKKRKLERLKNQEDDEEDYVLEGCEGNCGGCGGAR